MLSDKASGKVLREGAGKCRILENFVYGDLEEERSSLHTGRQENGELQVYLVLYQGTGKQEYRIKIFKSEKSMKKHKGEKYISTLSLSKRDFCGLESGTYTTTQAAKNKAVDVTNKYLAIICKKNTVICSWNKEEIQQNEFFIELWQYLRVLSDLGFDETLSFDTNRAEEICNEIWKVLEPRPSPNVTPRRPTMYAIEEYYEFAREQSLISSSEDEQGFYSCVDSPLPQAPTLPDRDRDFTIDLNKMAKHSKRYIRQSARVFYERQHQVYSELPALPSTPAALASHSHPGWNMNIPTQDMSQENLDNPEEDNTDSTDDISRTLSMVLGLPRPYEDDTLRLNPIKRRKLCMGLYNAVHDNKPDWEYLAGEIGLSYGAVILVKAVMLNQLCSATAGEIILLHWQHMYNKYYRTTSYTCEQPCTIAGLTALLEKMGRLDLVNEIIK